MADDAECNTKSLLADEEAWLVFLEKAFRKNSNGANALALLLFTFKDAIENVHDLGRAIDTLLDGIRLTYLYTEEHKLALRLYMLYLTGHLKPQDEPLNLLSGAIERGMAEIKRTRSKKGGLANSSIMAKRGLKEENKTLTLHLIMFAPASA